MSKPSSVTLAESQSGDAVIEGEFIVIRVAISALTDAFALGPMGMDFKVTDLPVFTKELVNALNDGDPDTGCSLVHRMFDDAMESVVDFGSLAVQSLADDEEE